MSKVFVAVDVGCLECGEQSKVIGVFNNKDRADAALQAAEAQRADWSGEHAFFVSEQEVVK